MLYRAYTETKSMPVPGTLGTGVQTTSLRIQQVRRRLEAIMVEIQFQSPATAPTLTHDGYFNILREVRLKVNDVIGQRNAIQCGSMQLYQFACDNGLNIDRYSLMGSGAATATKGYRMIVPIWIRHPAIQEPVGNILGIPLDQLNDDPTLELDFAPTADCASANPVTSILGIHATLLYRDVDPAVKYLPTELVSNKWVLPSTGRNSYDIPNGGFLSSVFLDSYSTLYQVRASLFATGFTDHELQVDLGSVAVRRYFPTAEQAFLDATMGIRLGNLTTWRDRVMSIDVAGSDAVALGMAHGHHCLDFLFDDLPGGAMSPASLLNCNTIPLGGDKVKITGTNFSVAGSLLVTHHKFLTRDPNDLKALVGA